ncbi:MULTISPECIES: PadR family transcriptional regulator [unclassified Brevundimonas]|uniref:PadR family transcriptional regulator n=1 Tax=unclassified Brevundimonas TaxID=2622653 RepID=UPI000CFC00AE|nr:MULTISPECIES: PadR family transcriptional regulator [unclassified Brevundimonas]PRA22529.1 PadR family transcriptional regulator [Brevundimonas sp. MYb27]PQZ77406.1 PadR family transcriptional regulator [Brevundimonas sp. MYb31]PRB13219.1 PadR family transcriptional regulator [Brevundimonas sp. MYb52]PRB33845.1 PadR family transcriptional regulator [Brevundimonas sp. MYb46]PRB41778.1 PadR family transcriptional regulator [Brevundimonas sp. MYb33]
MSLPHALLTSLAERPGSGSELANRFDRSIGYFWQATHQQIYRELARLEAAGWVEAAPVEGARGGKRRFCILAPGRAELQRWIGEHQDPPAIRDELMVRLRAEAVVGPTGLAEELEAVAARHRDKLAAYLAIEARHYPSAPAAREQRLQHLVLKAGIEFERQRIALCEEAVAILQTPL